MSEKKAPFTRERLAGFDCLVSLPPSGAVSEIILLLHGSAHNGAAMFRAAASLARQMSPQAAIYAPHAPLPARLPDSHVAAGVVAHRPVRTADKRRDWFYLPSSKDALHADSILAQHVGEAVDGLHQLINQLLPRYHLDESKLTLAGFSQGGIMATHVAVERLRPCKAVYNFCGLFFDPVSYLNRPSPQSKPPIFYGVVDGDEVLDPALVGATLHHFRKYKLPVTCFVAPAVRHIERLVAPSGRVVERVVAMERQAKTSFQRAAGGAEVKVLKTAHYVPPAMIESAVFFSRGMVAYGVGTNALCDMPVAVRSKNMVQLTLALRHASPKSAFGRLVALGRLVRQKTRLYVLNPIMAQIGGGLPVHERFHLPSLLAPEVRPLALPVVDEPQVIRQPLRPLL